MDGEQGSLKSSWRNSLQLRLSLFLSAAVLVLAAAAGFYSFTNTYREISTLQDIQLKQVAEIVTPYSKVLQENNIDNEDVNIDEDEGNLPPPRLLVQDMRSKRINTMFGNDQAQHYLALMADGFHNFELSGQNWRLYIHTYDKKHRIVAAQRAVYREKIAGRNAWNSVIPWVLLIPVMWLLIAIVVSRMFRYFHRAARDMDKLNDYDLQALSGENLPGETYVFINAINRLLARLTESFGAYRRFIGDAAHELRTPVTALSLQAARLDEAGIDEAERKKRVRVLQNGVRRMQSLLSDLLTLARIHNHRNNNTEISAALTVLRHVIEEVMPAAQENDIDLGVIRAEECALHISEIELRAVFKNLIENAVRYTPRGGQVDVSLQHLSGRLVFCVADNGNGIADADKEQIFEPFYRAADNTVEGSGLGLAIVKSVCEQYGADIELGDSPLASLEGTQHGLAVSVIFPEKMCTD